MVSPPNISTLVLLGLAEIEGLRYVCCAFSAIVYFSVVTLSTVIVYAVITEPSLHEPMYILIGNLVLNGLFGSSSILPKLIIDLISLTKTISYAICIVQALAIGVFGMYEMCTFTVMACDRYLAVCHPLHYKTLMTNEKVRKVLAGCWIFNFMLTLIAFFLIWNIPLCGDKINNIFCENMSIVTLSCVDSSPSRFFTGTLMTTYFTVTIVVTVFSYLKICLTCLKLSRESRQKAFHTLVTHLINFTVFLIGVFFIVIRYRLGDIQLSLSVHITMSIIPGIVPTLLNPLIYGIRTRALKIKVLKLFRKAVVERPNHQIIPHSNFLSLKDTKN
ncbi:olfactory receptor 4B13-like [Hyperolius riggenbachi]|uniref:olfactory receptor 4B13-like n=1 Tax=Hyperolius riggenbachi TaxID=752182 RepID=UPI0035A295B3